MKIGKRQRQHHHDQTTEWIKHLFPELDFIALGRLVIGLQMADVVEKINRGHALGLEQGD